MMRVLRRIETIWIALAMGGLALTSGCSKQAQQPSSNATLDLVVQDTPTSEPAPTFRPVRPPAVHQDSSATSAHVPAAKPLSADAQMIDDADAAGLTARVPGTRTDTPDVASGEGNEASR